MSVRKHECAREGCERMIPTGLLMCASDWALVPKTIQHRVYRGWNDGAVTDDWLAACDEAVAAIGVKK